LESHSKNVDYWRKERTSLWKGSQVPERVRHQAEREDRRTWEGEVVSAQNAAKQLATVFELFSESSKIRGKGELAHLLIYIDRVRTSKASSSPAKT